MTDVGVRPQAPPAATPSRRGRILTAPHVAAAFVLANVVLICASRVPHQNEYVYLLRLKALADPSFLRGDWTYEGPFREHLVFNTLFAPFTRVMSIELLGWAGRVSCWVGLTLLLLALARRVGARPWPAAIALVAWLACQSALVGGDWVFGTFEAKPIAYVLLFSAILFAFRNATVPALAAAGLAFAFHPGVGVWSVPAFVVVLLFDPVIGREARRWWWVAALTALPGVWGVVSGLGDTAAPREVWSFVTDRALAFHLDPLYFGVGPLAALLLMFVYNVWYCRRESGTRELQLLGRFQVLLAPPMFAGLALYVLGADEHLKYFPFRVFPVITTLLFAFLVARDWPWRGVLAAVRREPRTRVLYGIALLALALTVVSVNPLKEYAYTARANYRDWTHTDTSLQRTFRWISRSTPPTAVVVMPPSAPDSFYLAERPQIANLKALSFENVAEWRDRIVTLLGPTASTGAMEPDDPALEAGYDRLPVATIDELRRRYGAEYLVSRGRYPFPVVHREGSYAVYELSGGS